MTRPTSRQLPRLLLALALGGASTACALAAVGGVLYAGHPQQAWALQCFAAWGFAAGLVCGGLHLHAHGQPAHSPQRMATQELQALVRAAEAGARAERQAGRTRPGSAADRRPAPEPAAASPVASASAPQPMREAAEAVATP